MKPQKEKKRTQKKYYTRLTFSTREELEVCQQLNETKQIFYLYVLRRVMLIWNVCNPP